jgi:leucyl aminopeptidase
MNFKTQAIGAGGLCAVAADALLVLVTGSTVPDGLDKPIEAMLSTALKDGDFTLKPGQTFYAHRVPGVKAARLAFVAAGDGSAKSVRKAVAAGVALLKGGGSANLAVALAGVPWTPAHAEALVSAVTDCLYSYRLTKPSAAPEARLKSVALCCAKDDAAALKTGLARGESIAEGVTMARELANRPGNYCTPTHLAEEAKALGKAFGMKVEVLERKQLEKLGMGSFLAVAQGSDQPPKFIVARWMGGAKSAAPVVLVGKGITFDSGGISIKPAAEMDEMKYDMGGAASVLGTLRAVAGMKAKVNLIGVIPSCENMPDGRAVKPGDVVTSMSGQTIEVLNTDAEGRLILCDALTYVERFKPAAVVDIATLTGACVVALGHHRSGLFSADDALAAELQAAGDAALDPAWRMPLDEEYDEALKSNFADMGNVGGRAGGAITAAKFLQRFTGKLTWAHLDIAGSAWKSGASKGATGRPVALLTHFVLGRAG